MVLVLKLLFFILAAELWAQQPSAEDLLRKGSEARLAENYETAVRAWQQGQELYPDDVRFPAALGDLFYEKKLHNLAAKAYERARVLRPFEYEYALRLSETYGLLNRDHEAVAVLEKILPQYPNDWDVLQNLAWLLFKTEALTEGVDLLQSASRRLGTNASAEMTLGTLYASLYEYERSKSHYLKSIEIGKATRTQHFLSIAWYNLSILENTFLQYDQALQAIQNSLQYANRPSGLLALGEMYQKRGDYELARLTYEEAATKDETPLSLMNLVKLYLQTGDPDSAAYYLNLVERHQDPSWIYNFGLREEDWKRDVHEAWADIYDAKVALNHYRPRFWPWEWAAWFWDHVQLVVQAWLHREQWREFNYRSAEVSGSKGNLPAQLWKQYRTYHGYEWPAIKYLRLNRTHDETRIPGISAFYDMREALDQKDVARVTEALPKLDPVWDAALAQQAMAFLVKSGRWEYIQPLWIKNPGLLLVNARPMGFRLEMPDDVLDWPAMSWGQWLGLFDEKAEASLILNRDQRGLRWTARVPQKSREGYLPADVTDSSKLLNLLILQTHQLLINPSSSRSP